MQEDYLIIFQNYLNESNINNKTIKAYLLDVNSFVKNCKNIFNKKDVLKYYNEILIKYKDSTFKRKFISLNLFYNILIQNDFCETNLINDLKLLSDKTDNKINYKYNLNFNYIDLNDLNKILKYLFNKISVLTNNFEEFYNYNNLNYYINVYLIILLMSNFGLNQNDISNIKMKNFNIRELKLDLTNFCKDSKVFKKIFNLNKKDHNNLLKIILFLSKYRHNNDYLIYNLRNNKINEQSIRRYFKNLQNELDIKISYRLLINSFIKYQIEMNNIDLYLLSLILNIDFEMIKIYLNNLDINYNEINIKPII